VISSKSIRRSLLFSTQGTLRPQSRPCGFVERRSLLIFYSLEKDLCSEQLVTIKHENNLKLSPYFENNLDFFALLIGTCLDG